ncbi:MSCRAMM family collagen-binding adhesin EcbA [Enterococcus thailandicus]|uniref:MSCRAMM family collagen-binding adhesin EcbA n=1 Tax=Enterococcus thailandicus TaxID=417368 RepID=UPI0022DED4DC|nr:MSCRAMM family collagen-binding adhesin EcbA [Enterococcus thailandicus]
MKKFRFTKWQWLTTIIMVCQTMISVFTPIITNATEIDHPQTVTIQYDPNKLYHVIGKYSNGTDFSSHMAPTFANYNGNNQLVFCIDPGIPIPNSTTPGYEKNPLPSMSQKAKLISVLWRYAGTDDGTQLVAQKMIWQEVNGLTITNMNRPDGTSVSISSIETKINQVISDYQKMPSFHNQTTTVALGKSVTLTDTNGSKLSDFDTVVQNTSNIDYWVNGNQLVIKPNANSKETGILTLKKSMETGTPIVYKKAGLQTLMAGAIDEPQTYSVKIKVETKGNLKIVKRDKESGELVPNTVFHLDFEGSFQDQYVKTGDDGSATIQNIPHETKVTITEKEVPKPYTIDTKPITATIQAGETIEVTSSNYREKGQIMLDKSGVETGNDLWNERYSLSGNVFDIRKDSSEGPIVQTITTDAKGYAETPSEITKALELGTYYVTERQASDGFVTTFDPVKIKLNYANQSVPIVVETAQGKNQEITGRTILTKEDKETGSATQGSATFDHAEYTLYYATDVAGHNASEAVQWSDNFKPELVKGTKADSHSVTVSIDANQQVEVTHLALGDYYWQETRAPEGYAIDQTNYSFSITKIDDSKENAVITKEVTAKEQVIRLNFDFFKFVNSTTGSASAGVNGLTFKVTPLDGTKTITGAEDTATTSYNGTLGFDGYGQFTNLPYGDYHLEEIEAPKGYQKIKPLIIHSAFKEDKTDYSKSSYVFTIMEEDQKEPIKSLSIPYEQLTATNFSVSLNRLLLYDLPEENNTMTSLASWQNGEKVLTSLNSTEIVDQLSYKLNKKKSDWVVVSKAIDVEATKSAQAKDKNAKPVIIDEISKVVANQDKTGTWSITHPLTKDQVLGKTIVLYNYLYENEAAYQAGEAPIAVDENLENQAQTVKVAIGKQLTIQTKAHLKDGTQVFNYGETVDMYDEVEITHDGSDGSKESFETLLVALYPNGKSETIWQSGKIDYRITESKLTQTVLAKAIDTSRYPKGTKFTFKEVNYDSEGKINGKHNEDLKEDSQTISPKETHKSSSSLPQTGEQKQSVLLFIGFSLIFVITAYYLWKHHS